MPKLFLAAKLIVRSATRATKVRALLRLAFLSVLCVTVSACQTLHWGLQAARGQWQLWRLATPVDRLLDDEKQSADLRGRIALVRKLVEFGASELALTRDPGYNAYVELQRRFVVWNVFAVPEFSLQPRMWCFPIAGCVSYVGYFSEKSARNYAQRLARAGYDVWVGGVAAYSSLGRLDDPILSTWIWRDETELAALVFHELAHQRFYIPGDTAFNESLASLIEEYLVTRWLTQRKTNAMLADYGCRLETRRRFGALVQTAWQRLGEVYTQQLDDSAMRSEKVAILDQMRRRYAEQRVDWPEPGAYDQWMQGPLNNARLLAVLSYRGWLPALRALFEAEGENLQAFFERIEDLAELEREEREALLQRVSTSHSILGQRTSSCFHEADDKLIPRKRPPVARQFDSADSWLKSMASNSSSSLSKSP